MIEKENMKSIDAYLERQMEAMQRALAALVEIPSLSLIHI